MIRYVFFMAFGALAGDIRTFLVACHCQMLNLVKKARNAARGVTSMEWLKQFMTQSKYRQGDVLCKKRDAAAISRLGPLLRGFVTPSLAAQGRQRLPSYFNIRRGNPRTPLRSSHYPKCINILSDVLQLVQSLLLDNVVGSEPLSRS